MFSEQAGGWISAAAQELHAGVFFSISCLFDKKEKKKMEISICIFLYWHVSFNPLIDACILHETYKYSVCKMKWNEI